MEFVKRHKKVEIAGALIFLLLLLGPSVYANVSTRAVRYDLAKVSLESVPERRVAIVFGAGILSDGEPTPYLKWRVQTAAVLYKAGRVQKLLLSGDNGTTHHNEPQAMKNLAMQEGVPASAIVLDDAGFNTYDTCYRAHAIFGLSSAVLVSQGYHLPRAIMTCAGLGVRSIGVDAVHTGRDFTVSYIAREWLSTDKAVFQVIFKPHPTLLGPTLFIK